MTYPTETERAADWGGLVRRRLRRWRRRVLTSVGAMLVVYIVFAVWFHTGKPTIARNFTAEFNETFAAVPETDRAWPVYREAVLRLPVAEHHPGLVGWPEPPVTGPDAGPTLEYLSLAAEALDLTHRAAAMPVLGYELTDAHDQELYERRHGPVGNAGDTRFHASGNPLLLNVVMDQHTVLRELTRLMRIDMRVAAVQGDSERVFADVMALLEMARHADQDITLVSQLMSFAIRMVAVEGLAEAMGTDPDLLSVERLEELYGRLTALDGGARPDLRLDGERSIVLDLAQRMFTDDGAGSGRICFAGIQQVTALHGGSVGIEDYVFGPVSAMVYGSRRDFVAEYDRLLSLFRKDIAPPVWEQAEEWESARAIEEIQNDSRATVSQRLVAMLIPALSKAAISAESVRLWRDAALVGIAAELHRRRTGRYPETAAELADRFPNGLPADWIDGRPLRYAVVDGRAVVYSLGPDGDDDGGRLPEKGAVWIVGRTMPDTASPATTEGRRRYDGDLVLWPRRGEDGAVQEDR